MIVVLTHTSVGVVCRWCHLVGRTGSSPVHLSPGSVSSPGTVGRKVCGRSYTCYRWSVGGVTHVIDGLWEELHML